MIPKVSVVIPTYQRATLLRNVVQGLLAQTLTDIEIIVADDGSTDNTPHVMAQIRDPRLRYLRCDHMGMPKILNEGIKVARGEYLMTCHDHDIYDERLLDKLSKTLDRHTSVVYAHCGVISVDPTGTQEIERYIADYPEVAPGKVFLVEKLLPLLDCKVSALTMLRRAALNGQALNPRFGECADVELWLRLSTIGDVAYLKEPLIRVRQRDASSAFYHMGFRMTEKALDAKKLYLHYVEDEARRIAICRRWRVEVDRTGLLELWRVLEDHRYEEVPAIIGFVRREGTQPGHKVLTFLSHLSPIIALAILRSAKHLQRGMQKTVSTLRLRLL